eukprot:1682739-Amphidinium_carterae.8
MTRPSEPSATLAGAQCTSFKAGEVHTSDSLLGGCGTRRKPFPVGLGMLHGGMGVVLPCKSIFAPSECGMAGGGGRGGRGV